MSRVCSITGKRVMSGNNVSHAMNHTRRRFLPNLQNVSLGSDLLGQTFKLRLSTHALRTIEHNGGLDRYLLSTPSSRLSEEALKLKKRLKKALDSQK